MKCVYQYLLLQNNSMTSYKDNANHCFVPCLVQGHLACLAVHAVGPGANQDEVCAGKGILGIRVVKNAKVKRSKQPHSLSRV